MLGFGFQAWLLGLKPMGFGFRPPHVKPLQGANGTAGKPAGGVGFEVVREVRVSVSCVRLPPPPGVFLPVSAPVLWGVMLMNRSTVT